MASLVAFIDRQVVAIVVEPLKTDLDISDTEIGWLYGVFAIFYAVAALPIASAADRHSRKHIIAIGIFVWSLMTIACGLSRGYWQIFMDDACKEKTTFICRYKTFQFEVMPF